MTEALDMSRRSDGPMPTPQPDGVDPAEHAHGLAALARVTGGIAHDFNNLLQVIGGYADVIQALVESGSVDLARFARANDAIRAATDQAAHLTQKLREISEERDPAGRVVDLNAVIEGMRPAIDLTVGEAIERGVELANDLATTALDPAEFETALVALLINARDATPVGGRIVIRTENVALEDRQAALVEGVAAGRYAAVSVSDTGTGMAPEDVVRATEPFFSTKEPGKAHGLGLALVDRFARRARGAVKICSTLGSGTTVRLLLPAQFAAAHGEEAAAH